MKISTWLNRLLFRVQKPIYTITTTNMTPLDYTTDNINEERTRVVGWYNDLETAKQCVSENWLDIYEDGHYKYAIIEEVYEGLYGNTTLILWFEWKGDIETGGYVPIDNPDPEIIAYGIG